MSESAVHMDLVRKVYFYVGTIVPTQMTALVQVDSPETQRTTNVNGFYPDVFFQHKDMLVIGEAKTEADFFRKHSQSQYDAYIDYCRSFNGNATFVIGVPWQVAVSAKNYFVRLNRAGKRVPVIIMTELGQILTA